MKGYYQDVVCNQQTIDYNSVAATSEFDCSSKCDSDASCAAFVFDTLKCSKRLYSDLHGAGAKEQCYALNKNEHTVTEEKCKEYCDENNGGTCTAYSYSGGKCSIWITNDIEGDGTSGTCFVKGNTDPYYFIHDSKRKCMLTVCPSAYHRLDDAGTCEICPDGYWPDSTGRACEKLEFTSEYQIYTEKGEFEECVPYHFPDSARRRCISKFPDLEALPKHQDYYILDTDGNLIECDERYFPDAKGRQCVEISCQSYEILNSKGFCEECAIH